MHINSLKKIERELRAISIFRSDFDFNSRNKSMLHDGISYSLPNESVKKFNEIIEKILKQDDFQSKFSSNYIENKIKYIFSEIVKNNEVDVLYLLEQLISELSSYSEEWTVYLKIVGIEMDCCSEFGNVKLMPGESYLLDRLKEKAKYINDKTLGSDEGKKVHFRLLTKELEDLCNATCVSCVQVIAEPIRARQLAIEETERVIDLMNYLAKSLYPREQIKINTQGVHPVSLRKTIAFTSDHLSTSIDSIGTPVLLKINHETIRHIEEINGFKISEIIAKKQTTKFEESLIKCLHWFSVALHQAEPTNSYLFNIIAIESLFKQVQGSSIGSTVSESTAFILQSDMNVRLELVKTMRKYYSNRSAVAHGGKTVINDSDLMNLFNGMSQ